MDQSTHHKMRVTIHSEAGKVTGSLAVPQGQTMQSLLNAREPFLELSEVRLETRPEILSFLSMQRRAVRFAIPFHPDDPAVGIEECLTSATVHRVICMLADGEVEGDLEVPEEIRLPDYLEHTPGFFPMRNCRARVPAHVPGHGRMAQEKVPLLFVNGGCAIGVFESPAVIEIQEEAMLELTGGV